MGHSLSLPNGRLLRSISASGAWILTFATGCIQRTGTNPPHQLRTFPIKNRMVGEESQD